TFSSVAFCEQVYFKAYRPLSNKKILLKVPVTCIGLRTRVSPVLPTMVCLRNGSSRSQK
ncbi:hypothetical protein BaRGS_00030662, partial [Batillaria attramentaria]